MTLEVKDLYFSYGGPPVLDGVSFSAGAGELIAVLGPNGVGKSTLFRCMLGFLTRYRGEIRCDGDEVRSLGARALARRIAYIPQSAAPVFDYTVEEFVVMGAAASMGLLAQPKAAQMAEARETLDALGIGGLARRGYAHLSGGERQLVLLARALVQKAGILIMDEPTANLDYGNQLRVMDTIRGLADKGYTVLLSTHNPDHALQYAARALVLHRGRVLADGAPDRVLTPEVMKTIYGVEVELRRVDTAAGPVTVCLPGGR